MLAAADEWQDLDFEVTLESGCVEHVCDRADIACYPVEPSQAPRAGLGFVVGNGNTIPNQGQSTLQLDVEAGEGINRLNPCFQTAQVTRPLMSVSKICDHDYTCHGDNQSAEINDQKGQVVCTFIRRGGLYDCTLRLGSPFTRQGVCVAILQIP